MPRIYIAGPPDADEWFIDLDGAPGKVGKIIEVTGVEYGMLEGAL